MNPTLSENFQAAFCTQYGVPPMLYGATVLRLTLYPHARWLADTGPHRLLAPDRSFIDNVGRLNRWRDFSGEAEAFQQLPENGRFWRRRLRLRVSIDRMRVLFSDVMGGTPALPLKRPQLQDESESDPGALAAE